MNGRGSLLPDDPITEETILGVVIGLVSQTTDDPLALNRVLVDFPTLQVSSAWARVCSFAAGPNRGAFFLPQVGDEVLIAFEAGDAARPYVVGALWNGVDLPPVPAAQIQDVRQIQTPSGAYLKFDDTNQGTSITLTDKTGNQIVIDTANNAITLTSTGDLTIKAQGKLSLTAASIEIAAQGGSLTLSASGNAALLSDGEVTVSGNMIRLN